MTTDNASNFVKSFTQFQQREQSLIPMVMEEDESETTTTGDNLPGGEEEIPNTVQQRDERKRIPNTVQQREERGHKTKHCPVEGGGDSKH